MFSNSMIISVIQLGFYLIASYLINMVGNKNIIVLGLMIAGSCGISLYWAQDSATTLILAALYISLASLSSTTLVGSIVSMFPTSTRTMNVSLAMMFGRSGAIIGNMIFPILMTLGCLPLFGFIGASALSKTFQI